MGTLKVGITGGIGSGKTTVCNIFKILSIPIFNADEQAKHLMQHDGSIRQKIIEAFGPGAYNGTELDRKYLASIIFNAKDKLKKMNSIVHPAVEEAFNDWYRQYAGSPYVIKEAAILFESQSYKKLDKIICILAPEEMRSRRVELRDRVSAQNVKERMKNQWPEKKMAALSDYTITNDNHHLLVPQCIEIHNDLKSQRRTTE